MEHFHLTTPQQNIWNLQKYYQDTAISNLCGAIFYRENRDSSLLKQAIRFFIESQSGIRLQFHEGEETFQQVCPEVTENIPVLAFPSMKAFDSYAEKFAREPLGLVDRAMYRFAVFQIGEESGILVVLSHLVSDAWTFGIMANQVDEAYHRLEAGEGTTLLQADYREFIRAEANYFMSERFQKDKVYWEEKYAARPEESPVKPYSSYHGSVKAKRITKVLSTSLEKKIAAFSGDFSITSAVLFETALILYLSHINPENQAITIGVPVLNRSGAKEKRIAGMFVSTMPLTILTGKEVSVVELARQISRGHMDIFRHQKYPYSYILKTLREKQNFSGNLYDAMVSYQNARTETGADTKWYSNGYSEIPLAVHIDNRDGHDSHTINVDYQTDVFGPGEAQYLIARLEYILEQVTEDGDKRIWEIGIIPESERKKITEEFNDTAVDYPRDKCVHELFEEQVERTPDRVALVAEDKALSYRELNAMANRVAHALIAKGVKMKDIVAFSLPRKSHMIAVMFGILKCGAAYMPIDEEYPQNRIDYMLHDSRANIYYEKQL